MALTENETPRIAVYVVGPTPSAGPFDITFPFYDNDEVEVYVGNVLTAGVTITHTTPGGTSGNTVTLNTPVSSTTVSVVSSVGGERSTGDNFVQVELSKEVDRIFARLQEIGQRGFFVLPDNVSVDLGNRRLSNVLDPALGTDAVTKDYADAVILAAQGVLSSINAVLAAAVVARAAAELAETHAETAETNAETAETAAAGSASAAAASASAASGSATSSSTSAGSAAASAAAAEGSATTASTEASIATTKAGEAAASATTASTQAGIATTKAGEAAASATAAAGSATSASTSASGASASASAAASSASAAAASAASIDPASLLSKAGNLSGLTDLVTARANLGLGGMALKSNVVFADLVAAAVRLSSEGITSPTDTELSTTAWVAAALSLDLLGTLNATSGTTQTLSGLTLTNYKALLILVDGVSNDAAAARHLRLGGQQISSSNTFGAATHDGVFFVALGTGRGVGMVIPSGTNADSYRAASTGITTASTSLPFTWDGAGNFDGGGKIHVLGIK